MKFLAIAVLAVAPAHHHRPGCSHLYSIRQGERPASVIYAGTRHVTMKNLRTMGRMEMCQRHKQRDQPIVRSFDRRLGNEHATRVEAASAPTHSTDSRGWTWPWSCIADHEGEPPGNPATDTGNGFYGGLQFTMSTWESNGGTGNPADASIPEQERVAERVLAFQGWGAWPNSSVACGL